jgi:hypothetical protein
MQTSKLVGYVDGEKKCIRVSAETFEKFACLAKRYGNGRECIQDFTNSMFKHIYSRKLKRSEEVVISYINRHESSVIKAIISRH